MRYLTIFLLSYFSVLINANAQGSLELVFPDSSGWNILSENRTLAFQLKSNQPDSVAQFSIEGTEGLNVQFDEKGHFKWTPSYDIVDRVARTKDFTFVFSALRHDGKRLRKSIVFIVRHVNRPPVVEDLPSFYVKQSTLSTYQVSGDFVFDPDGDPLVFRPVLSQMPEGMNLTSQGLLTWSPSRSQFNALANNPNMNIEFLVQDQPDKAETRGRLKVARTQMDLPPEILILPSDSVYTLKEDENINLKIYLSDPNGDDNVKNAGLVSSDNRLATTLLSQNTQLQYEFTWMPGYTFVDDVKKSLEVILTFYVLDKSNNRAQRRVKIKVLDTENMAERDAHLFQKYRNNLVAALMLLDQLDKNQKDLNNDYKKARKGKKNRSIINATLGATTGVSGVALKPDQSKIVSGVGGTTVLTLGTLEATEVVGRSKDAILEKIKIGIEIRNKIQAQGDDFARKYALKSARRSPELDKDIEKLRAVMNDQKLVLLELDAYDGKVEKIDNGDIKKAFIDFNED